MQKWKWVRVTFHFLPVMTGGAHNHDVEWRKADPEESYHIIPLVSSSRQAEWIPGARNQNSGYSWGTSGWKGTWEGLLWGGYCCVSWSGCLFHWCVHFMHIVRPYLYMYIFPYVYVSELKPCFNKESLTALPALVWPLKCMSLMPLEG